MHEFYIILSYRAETRVERATKSCGAIFLRCSAADFKAEIHASETLINEFIIRFIIHTACAVWLIKTTRNSSATKRCNNLYIDDY